MVLNFFAVIDGGVYGIQTWWVALCGWRCWDSNRNSLLVLAVDVVDE